MNENKPLILEVQIIRVGLGCRVVHYPETRHIICHVGTIESRVIVPKHRTGCGLAIVGLLLCGLILSNS